MALVSTEAAVIPRHRLVRAYLDQSAAALALLLLLTVLRTDGPQRILGELGGLGPALIVSLLLFAGALAFLRFPLTRDIFVAPAVAAHVAIIPLLGLVLSTWLIVLVAVAVRALSMAGVGPAKIKVDDLSLELVKLFGLLSTYGLPAMAAAFVYQGVGGTSPPSDSSLLAGGRIVLAGIVFILTNVVMMQRVQMAYGYSGLTRLRLAAVDSAIYFVALPYSVLVDYCWVALRFRGILPAMLTGLVAMLLVRKLAAASAANDALAQRLASLANVAAALSISGTPASLLRTVHEECSRAMDTSLFTIAILDEEAGLLRFELEIRDGQTMPPSTIHLGEGLNSWVVLNRKPLLLRTAEQEQERGVRSVDDGVSSESWLGVPMVVRDRVVGVISVQSYRQHAFTDDDVVVLNAVASQTAAALDNSTLYRNLQTLNLELEDRVTERTLELQETNLRLAAADHAKTRFLATMSHELRTPLNAIIGFSEILIDKTAGAIAPRLHHFVVNIRDSGTHLLSLINDILDLSKVEAGKMELKLAPFDLPKMILGVEQVMRGVASESEVTILSGVDPGLSEVVLDEGRIRQVLLNLLANAVKFSPPGGLVRILVERRDEVASPLHRPSVQIRVVDRGIGIPGHELPRIFEEFYQTAEARARRKGTGLGLALARRFVELHGGTIAAESKPGEGTTLVVDLPLHAGLPSRERSEQVTA